MRRRPVSDARRSYSYDNLPSCLPPTILTAGLALRCWKLECPRSHPRHSQSPSLKPARLYMFLCLPLVFPLNSLLAAYYIAFGPHGPRKPTHDEGYGMHVFLGSSGIIAASLAVFFIIRSFGESSLLLGLAAILHVATLGWRFVSSFEGTLSNTSPSSRATTYYEQRIPRADKRNDEVKQHESDRKFPSLQKPVGGICASLIIATGWCFVRGIQRQGYGSVIDCRVGVG